MEDPTTPPADAAPSPIAVPEVSPTASAPMQDENAKPRVVDDAKMPEPSPVSPPVPPVSANSASQSPASQQSPPVQRPKPIPSGVNTPVSPAAPANGGCPFAAAGRLMSCCSNDKASLACLGALLMSWVLQNAGISLLTQLAYGSIVLIAAAGVRPYITAWFGFDLPQIAFPSADEAAERAIKSIAWAVKLSVSQIQEALSWQHPSHSVRVICYMWFVARFQCLFSFGSFVFALFCAHLAPVAWGASKDILVPLYRSHVAPKVAVARNQVNALSARFHQMEKGQQTVSMIIGGAVALAVFFWMGIHCVMCTLMTAASLFVVGSDLLKLVCDHSALLTGSASGAASGHASGAARTKND